MNLRERLRGVRRIEPPSSDPFEAELTARVERAYAPEPETLARGRAQALAAFRSAAPGRAAGRSPRRSFGRPLGALAFSLALVAASVGLVAAESGPGQPFYGLRLAVEALSLPAPGSPGRLSAEVTRLDARLAEAAQAARAHDAAGVSAALAAYLDELRAPTTQIGPASPEARNLQAALANHVAILAGLAGEVPPAAQAGLEQALDQVARATQRLQGAPATSPLPRPSPAPAPVVSAAPSAPALLGTPGSTAGQPTSGPGASHRPSHSPGAP